MIFLVNFLRGFVLLAFAGLLWLWLPVNKGFKQQLLWGQRPPYHWVANPDNDVYQHKEFHYTGSNGEVCAEVWTGPSVHGWTVYGWGFDADSLTFDAAQQIAYENCY